MAEELSRMETKNFIEAFVEEDISKGGQFEGMQVHTRFPPEPNGYLHIGHCKALCIDFGTAEKFGGICNLRMDDTNPTKEDTEYVDAIKEDIKWLGFTWDDRFYYASQYFDKMYECAEDLIKKGLAYVCELTPEQMREYRGDLTTPARSPYRDRPIEESLDLFRRMKAGEFPNGAMTLRAKIDLASGCTTGSLSTATCPQSPGRSSLPVWASTTPSCPSASCACLSKSTASPAGTIRGCRPSAACAAVAIRPSPSAISASASAWPRPLPRWNTPSWSTACVRI